MDLLHRTPQRHSRTKGFTLVELLIVIVVIAILAAISVVAYNGIQERARDAQRNQDIKTIAKALEMYYLDQGRYPTSNCGLSCPTPKKIGNSWATTSDGSWAILEEALVPEYISNLPNDPRASTTTNAGLEGGYNYDFFVNTANPGSCAPLAAGQLYMLSYRLEASGQDREVIGDCVGTQPTNYSSSEYMVVK